MLHLVEIFGFIFENSEELKFIGHQGDEALS